MLFVFSWHNDMVSFLGKIISYFSVHFMLLKTRSLMAAERKEQT